MSDADGQMKVTEVATRPLVQDLLNHEVSWCNTDQMKDTYIKGLWPEAPTVR